jgi:hypothetical protein
MAQSMAAPRKVILRAGDYTSGTAVFAPPAAALARAGVPGAPAFAATFQVTYHGFSAAAQTAFQAAVDIWAVLLTSPVAIRVDATWTALDPNVLGQAGPADIVQNFAAGAVQDTWYASALASKLAGADVSPGKPHIVAEFSSAFPNWHFGGLPVPAEDYDFTSVVLHELGHGLGFFGSADVEAHGIGSLGWNGQPVIWDTFVRNAQGERLLDTAKFPNPSKKLAGQLRSAQLFFDAPLAKASNMSSPVRVYAPLTWEPGSSYSHLDEVTFGAGNASSLMTPQIGRGEGIHAPGGVGLGMLADMGW